MRIKQLFTHLSAYALLCLSFETIALPSTQDEKWIDLTHAFSNETLYWPTADNFKLESVFKGKTEKDFFYSTNNYCASEHGGTHIDAPIHFSEGKQTLDEIPIEHLTGHAVVIDVSSQSSQNADYLVTVQDFLDFEKTHKIIPSHSIVLINTGYHKLWPNAKRYLGTEQRGVAAVKALHFPGVSKEAAEWLIKNKKVKAIGIDTASIDYGQSTLFEAHRIFTQHNVPIFENVAKLSEVPAVNAYIFALPMKIKGGSGGPLRIVALVANQK